MFLVPLKSRRKWLLRLTLLVATGATVSGFLSLGEILAGPAEQPRPSDLLVILGGGKGDRVVKAAELIKHQQAATVLVTGVWKEQPIDRFKSYDYRIEYLEKRGIPRAMIYIDATADSTWREALLVRKFMSEGGLKRVIVVSDPPHMRRLSRVYRKVFKSSGMEYRLVASEPRWWNSRYWWLDLESGVFSLKETIKIAYYWIRYEC